MLLISHLYIDQENKFFNVHILYLILLRNIALEFITRSIFLNLLSWEITHTYTHTTHVAGTLRKNEYIFLKPYKMARGSNSVDSWESLKPVLKKREETLDCRVVVEAIGKTSIVHVRASFLI